jgi:septal ring factor EnvC (AmiA/AmiB activator)
MPEVVTWFAGADSAPAGLTLGGLISGLGGAGALGIIYYIVKLVLDKTIPSRSDNRASTSLVLDSLSNMVKVLQDEKKEDAVRLKAKQDRIDQLESEADADFARIQDLRTEILELRERLGRKDRHIKILVLELQKLGATITGLDSNNESNEGVEVTMKPEEVRALRDGITEENR